MQTKLALSLVSLALAGVLPAQALAATSTADVERIVVTGSHIKRADMESASPVTLIDAEQISRSGIANLEDLLQEMTASAGPAGNATNAYWTSNGYATAQVNLRGMGIKRTLVLLNGRRFVNGGTGANSSVDLNSIPTAMIKRIEVLKDGASAIYGADAVAGVVNIITKDDFNGAELSMKAGATLHGDGDNQEFNLMLGGDFADNRGHSVTNLSYVNTSAVRQSDRIDCPKSEENGQLICIGSSNTPGGRAHLANGDELQFNQTPGGDGNSFEPYDYGKHSWDWTPYLNAVSPTERINLANFTRFELSDRLSLFSEVLVAKRKSEQIVTPRTMRPVAVDADFIYNPVGEDLTLKRRRMMELGAPYFFQESDTIRAVLGFEGELNNGWQWDIAYNYGRNTANDGWTFDVDNQAIAETLDQDLCSTEPGAAIPCGDYFGIGELSPEVIDYITYRREGTGGNEMRSLSANITGDITSLPAGELAFAAGIDRRYESGWRNPDSIVLKNGGEEAIDGSFDVTEAYVEFSVPLLSNLPLAEQVNLDAALRYSDYNTFGSKNTYKLGLTWTVNDSLMLRGVRSTAFRTPTLGEQSGSTNAENLTTVDPCENATGAIAANCQAAGVPVDFIQDGTTVLTGVGGNPAVSPEEATTTTLGLIWEPAFLPGFSTTVDYFKIDMDDAISSVSGSNVLRLCYTDPVGYGDYCNAFVRDPQTHQVTSLQKRPVNAAKEEIAGIDFNSRYNFELMALDATVNLDLTRLLTHENTAFPGAETEDLVGVITEDRGSYTKWRGNLDFQLKGDDWAAGWSMRYIGKAKDENGGGPIGSEVPSIVYNDIQGSYFVSENLRVSVGFDNIFDKKAPFMSSWNDANTDVFTYDLLGRRGYIKMVYGF